MTRALQDRLALANNRIQHGYNRSVDSLPPGLEREMKRKRADSNLDIFSDTSSSVSGRCFSTGVPASSPLSGPIFSDDLPSASSQDSATKRARAGPSFIIPSQTQHRGNGRGAGAKSTRTNWKSAHHLPQSSPIRQQPPVKRPSVRDYQYHSFHSQVSTIFNSPSVSEDDDQDLPLHSFNVFDEGSNIPSSPPRTPSPSFSRSASLRGKALSPSTDTRYGGKEGADLLLYLASSPSPALHVSKSSPVHPPSTPPSKHTPLPSSMMNTPGGQPFFAFGSTTPNAAFNFADFVNVTPSPAQRRWPATPSAKTPLTGRRRDMPPPASPNVLRTGAMRKDAGLGMELGGELRR